MENQLRTTMRTYYQPLLTWSGTLVIGFLLLFTGNAVHAQRVPDNCTTTSPTPFTITSEDASSKTSNNAKIRVSGLGSTAYRVGYSTGQTYSGPAFSGATEYSALTNGYISQTLATPTAAENTAAGGRWYTIRVYTADTTCFTDKSFLLPYVNFSETPKFPDIQVTTAASGGVDGFFALGSTATVTVVVQNLGDTTANNVKMGITIPNGLTLTGNNAPLGTNYDTGNNEWTVGTVNKGETKTLTLTFTVGARGIRNVVANTLTQENAMLASITGIAPDKDSQPGNNAPGEDDYGAVCISTPYDFCQGDEYRISITSGNYTGIQWYKDGNLITGSTAGVVLNPDGTITIKSEGIYSYSYPSGSCPTGGCCPIKVEAGVAPDLQALTDQVICEQGTFAPVTASNTGYTGPTAQHPNGPVVYQWYNDNGTTNPTTDAITGQTGLSFTAFPTAPGTYKYKLVAYAQDHINCKDSTMITLTINPLPVAPTVADVTYCADEANPSALTAQVTMSSVPTGNTLQWYTSATGGTASTTAPIPSTINASNTTPVTLEFWVSQKVDGTGCEGPRAKITVTINPRPTPPVVANVTYCQEDVPTALTATAGSNSTLFWYGTNSTGGTGSTAAPTPSTTTAGSVTYYVTQQIDATGCESDRAALTVTVNPKPSAPTANNVTYCQEDSPVALTATAAGNQTLQWYTVATGGTATTTAPVPSTAIAGTFYYYVSQKDDNTTCESNRDTLVVLVNPKPVAPTVADVTYCADEANPSALTAQVTMASVPTGNTLQWYTSAVGGTASTTAPIPSTINASNTTPVTLEFWVSQKVDATDCEGPRAKITVTINPRPAAPTVEPVVYCQEDVPTALTATVSSGMTLFWYGTNSTGGTGSTAAPTPSTTTAGSVTYYVTQQIDATGCESNRAALTVTVNPKPPVPTVTNSTYCEGVTPNALTSNATAAAGQTLVWYGSNSTGGTASATPPVVSTATQGTYKFYVSQTDNITGCESDRSEIVILVNPTPAPPTVTNVTYCEDPTPNAQGAELIATGANGNAILWYVGGVPSTVAPRPSITTAGTTLYYVTQQVPGTLCESGMAVLTVTVNPIPVAEVIAVNSLCLGSETQNNGKLILTRYRNSDEVSWNIGSPYNSSTATAFAQVPANSNGTFATGLANPTTDNQAYTVRIKNSFECTIDRTPVLTKVDCGCPGGYCEPATVTKVK